MEDRTPLVDVQITVLISKIMKSSFIEYFVLFITCYFSLIFSANTADNQEFKLAAENGNLELVRQFLGSKRY